jgi:hypothetical protein
VQVATPKVKVTHSDYIFKSITFILLERFEINLNQISATMTNIPTMFLAEHPKVILTLRSIKDEKFTFMSSEAGNKAVFQNGPLYF